MHDADAEQRSEQILFRATPSLRTTLRNVAKDAGVSQTTVITALLFELFGSDEDYRESLNVLRARVCALRDSVDAVEAHADLSTEAEEIPPGDERRARMEEQGDDELARLEDAGDGEPVVDPARQRELKEKYPALKGTWKC